MRFKEATFTIALGYDDHESIYEIDSKKEFAFARAVKSAKTKAAKLGESPNHVVAEWARSNGKFLTSDPDYFLNMTDDDGDNEESFDELLEAVSI